MGLEFTDPWGAISKQNTRCRSCAWGSKSFGWFWTYCGWTKSVSHHYETIGNHCALEFTGASSVPGFFRWCEMDFVHPEYFEKTLAFQTKPGVSQSRLGMESRHQSHCFLTGFSSSHRVQTEEHPSLDASRHVARQGFLRSSFLWSLQNWLFEWNPTRMGICH